MNSPVELKIGSLACLPHHRIIASGYKDPQKDSTPTFSKTIKNNIIFVPLDIIICTPLFYRIKLLLEDSTICYLNLYLHSFTDYLDQDKNWLPLTINKIYGHVRAYSA